MHTNWRRLFTLMLGAIALTASATPSYVHEAGKDMIDTIMRGRNETAEAEIRHTISSSLKRNASRRDIEEFFANVGWRYTFDDFNSRYQLIVREVSKDPAVDQAIVIYIYVDREGRFTTFETVDSFTAP